MSARNKLNEALARKMQLKTKKVVPSGNVQGWFFNDREKLTESGHLDKGTQRKMREYNALDKMR